MGFDERGLGFGDREGGLEDKTSFSYRAAILSLWYAYWHASSHLQPPTATYSHLLPPNIPTAEVAQFAVDLPLAVGAGIEQIDMHGQIDTN